uniref:aconitase family protein n=1 Tax=Thauera sp. SDU_THAU2 TaxID=3136633 RepID=UPI00311F10C2
MPTVRAERGSIDSIRDPLSREQVRQLHINCEAFGVTEFGLHDARRASSTAVGPEQGATLPGMTVVAGDSHTSTHGAFGALALASAPRTWNTCWPPSA